MSRISRTRVSTGFTLVEMLIIAPIALLVIAGFVGVMITMVGDVLVSNGRNVMTHEIQGSLDSIEQDVRLSTEFLATTGAMPTPQGKDGSTSSFSSTSGDLILGEIATDKSAADPLRSFVYYDSPNGCSDPALKSKNRIFFTTVMYFVRSGSLWRRTFVPTASGTLCVQPWQVNTCAPGYLSSSTQCKTNDTEVMKNVNTFTVTYYTDATSSTPLTAANAPSASTISVQINGTQNIAGRTLSSTATVRSSKLSSKDITLSAPSAPTITAQAYDVSKPNTATFTWTADPLVQYSVRYNINGGSWIIASENTHVNSFKATAFRADTVTVQVAARNSTGSSAYGSGASKTLPSWETCNLQNSWVIYSDQYADCGYTKTTDGIIVLKGMIMISGTPVAATAQTLFTLPEGYRPTGRLMFQAYTYNSVSTNGVIGRVDVLPTGEVRIMDGNTGWITLNDIYFVPAGALYSRLSINQQNSWTDYSSSFASFTAVVDAENRVFLQGVVKPGTTTTVATMPNANVSPLFLPDDYRPPLDTRMAGYGFNYKMIDQSGAVTVPNTTNSYYSMQAMYHPNAFTGWHTLTLLDSWTNYGGTSMTPRYVRTNDCMVSLRGLIKNAGSRTTSFVALLPAGYRPKDTQIFVGTSSTGNYRVQVDWQGNVVLYNPSQTWSSLDGVSFVAGDGTPCPI